MNSCEFDIMHNIVSAGVGQLLNLGEGPRSNLSYHVSNFKATTLPYFFRIPHLKGILGLIQWLEPYPHHIQIHCQHHYHHHPTFATVCVLPFGKQEEMHFHICVPWLVKAGDLDAYHQYDEDHNGGNPLVTNPQLLPLLSNPHHGGILTGGNMLVSHHNHHGDCHHRSHFQYLGTIRI